MISPLLAEGCREELQTPAVIVREIPEEQTGKDSKSDVRLPFVASHRRPQARVMSHFLTIGVPQEEYLREYNSATTQFVWTQDADMILSKIRRRKEALGTAHWKVRERAFRRLSDQL